jgi:hypothetical protein
MNGMHASTLAKARRVLELYDQGVPMGDIEAETHTSRKTIRLIAREYGRAKRPGGRPQVTNQPLRVAPLREAHIEWLNAEAARLNISRGELMRAIIIDSIEEERASARR